MQFINTLDEIFRRTDIVAIASRLGIVIGKRESQYTTARCPFHDDKKPSLALYREPGNPHYYCFACGARGGILDLVEKQRRSSRSDSLKWLAEEVGVSLGAGERGHRDSSALGSDFFLEWMKRHHDDDLLKIFADSRSLDTALLISAGAFAVDLSALDVSALTEAEIETLSTAGVVTYRRNRPSLVASGKQIVFPLDRKQGFIFRAAESDRQLKAHRYRFSKGLRKSEMLFGASVAEQQLREEKWSDGLFVVEGLMDVLRLRSLGLPAVAVLGTSVSSHQAKLLKDLCRLDGKQVVPVHLFFDADDAGRRAAPAAVSVLLTIADPMPIDVIYPDANGDPDELLIGLDPEKARERLAHWVSSALEVLAHHYSRLPLRTVLVELRTARPLLRVETLRYIVAQLARRWLHIRDLADPSATYFGAERSPDSDWLREALDRSAGRQPADVPRVLEAGRPLARIADDPDVYLGHAMRIAQSSNFRREYPFDWGGMSRLALAARATSIIAKTLLADADRRPLRYAARFVPKEDGRKRLKAGPWPEDALLQQYVLSELLRARPDVPGWYFEFPAVRLIRQTGTTPVMTGPDRLLPVGRPGDEPRVVSFAYQIDQEIIEGDSPPRREGMFVPYRECWQQFIDHLDGFVARQPLATDAYFAVRLDISGFYDNLPRYAVEQVLQDAMTQAVERHFTGRDFAQEVANLLQPQRSSVDAENLTRAALVARWLCDQSFGYRYFDPSDGSSSKAMNPTVGIPQGPDLSAYLANLALYPVDRAATELIERERGSRSREGVEAEEAAVYGRYVDDMVIVSTSPALLAQIETTIGKELQSRGLSTNTKHERTKALDRRRIREWLLGERGAAVLVSAGGEETPTTNRARIEDLLAVEAETTRGHVLQLLHHDDLYSRRWSVPDAESVDAALRRLRTLRSIKLRYYDWVSAARWVLHSIAREASDANSEQFVIKLLARWQSIYGREEAVEQFGETVADRAARQEFLDLAPVLMIFDALERTIDSRYDRRQGYADNDTRHELRLSREKLSALVHEGNLLTVIFQHLRQDPIVSPILYRVASMLQIQHYGIRGLAASAAPEPSIGGMVNFDRYGSYIERRFAINALGGQIREVSAPILKALAGNVADEEAPEQEPLLGLHEALARLMAGAASNNVDPLAGMAETIKGWSRDLGLAAGPILKGLEPASVAIALVDQFLVDPSDSITAIDAETALPVFVEVVAGLPEGVQLLSGRNHLVANIEGRDYKALAVPPGINTKAFFARSTNGLTAFAFSKHDVPLAVDDVLFGITATDKKEGSRKSAQSSDRLVEFNCLIPETHQLAEPEEEPRVDPVSVTPLDLRTFAKAYRDLAGRHMNAASQVDELQLDSKTATSSPAVTPLHLLKPVVEGANWAYFGAEARLPVGAQAFVRLGADRLHSVAVHANGSHLWQIGFALADHLGYRGFARSSELDRLTVATLEPNDTLDSVPFYVMQLTVPRLCGAYLGRSRFQVDPAAGLPLAIERQLKRLETIADGTDATANLAELLEAGAEARAAELLSDARAPLQIAGSLSASFAAFGRAAARSERIFTENLPPAAPFLLTHRRTVDLWLASASRYDQLSPSPERIGLTTAAAAMRMVAVAKLAQALTLEVWALLTDQDWQHIGSWIPSLAEFELPDEALLIAAAGKQRSLPLHDQTVRLIGALRTHASSGATARAALDQITPLGWIVALATITGMIELEALPGFEEEKEALRPELLAARSHVIVGVEAYATRRLFEILIDLVAYLSTSTTEDLADGLHERGWPWGPYQDLVDGSADAVAGITEAAGLVGKLYGMQAVTASSRLFQITDADDRGYCLVLRKGEQENVAGWQIDRDSLRLTRPGDIETREDSSGGIETVWSETTRAGRLVSLSVGYRSLADLAGLSEERPVVEPVIPVAEFGIQHNAVTTAEPANEPTTEPVPGNYAPDQAEAPGTVEEGSVISDAPAKAVQSKAAGSRGEENAISDLAGRWHVTRRGDRLPSGFLPATIRIAILQMNINQVGHSFYHPICEVEGGEFRSWEGWLKKLRTEKIVQHSDKSNFEAWRRAILKEALRRCDTLNVELLVLPEYTTRPDTIAWLVDNLNSLAPRTSVLAGTFRLPAHSAPLNYHTGTAEGRELSLGAVVPLVVPGEIAEGKPPRSRKGFVYSRLKKYPSTGLSEFIRPEIGSRRLEAVYEMWPSETPAPERIRYVRDLICSEVFLAMAPANIFSSVNALAELRQRFGYKIDLKAILDEVKGDIEQIAIDTSPAIGRALTSPRKTIIAVPAATTRAFDHHIFGEAGAKAAGLTTAFSNMSGGGRGESCFIGHYKSQSVEGSHVWGLQSPYHGRAPGIWTYRFEGGRALGAKETALVVADVNPIDTNVSKPARQIENHPITLVAHIPFFIDDGDGEVRGRAEELAKKIINGMAPKPSNVEAVSSCELDESSCEKIKHLAIELAKVDNKCTESLLFRAEGVQAMTMQPHVNPGLPLLTDWAFIETPTEEVSIDVPGIDAVEIDFADPPE